MSHRIIGRMVDGTPVEIEHRDLGVDAGGASWSSLFMINGKAVTSSSRHGDPNGRLTDDLHALDLEGVSIGSLSFNPLGDGRWEGFPIPWSKHRPMIEEDFK